MEKSDIRFASIAPGGPGSEGLGIHDYAVAKEGRDIGVVYLRSKDGQMVFLPYGECVKDGEFMPLTMPDVEAILARMKAAKPQ